MSLPVQVFRRCAHSVSGAAESSESTWSAARALLADRRRILAITGAGISTDSGIPDYRSPGRPPHRPTSHQQFMASHATRPAHPECHDCALGFIRQRYWARSMQGYETLASSLPNMGHYALSYAEQAGRVSGVITQNVDLLHEGAGSRSVLHLHGTVREVRCMSCEALASRAEFQSHVRALNPAYLAPDAHRPDPAADRADHVISSQLGTRVVAVPGPDGDSTLVERHTYSSRRGGIDAAVAIPALQRPDGDSDLSHITDYSDFIVPSCRKCTDGFGVARPQEGVPALHLEGQPAGILKPDLVFFGANVPRGVHERADAMLAEADAILIAGTSLTVWSAFRLVRAALDRAAPGCASVVAVAAQIAKLQQAAAGAALTTDGSGVGSGNSIRDGSAILAPVTPFTVDLGSRTGGTPYPARVPATIPVVILNRGPTRADALLAAAASGVHKIEARAADAIHYVLDVPREATRDMEREVRRKRQQQAAAAGLHQASEVDPEAIQAAMRRHENIE